VNLVVIGFVDDHHDGLEAFHRHRCVFTDNIVLVDDNLDRLEDGVEVGFI
jgi:hypothetical protein